MFLVGKIINYKSIFILNFLKMNKKLLLILNLIFLLSCSNEVNVKKESIQNQIISSKKTASDDLNIIKSPTPDLNSVKVEIDNTNFVLVEGGTFKMGNSSSTSEADAKDLHDVKISSFYIGKYEVTQKEFVELMNKNLSKFKGDSLPIEMVNWLEAIKYCNARSNKEKLPIAYDPNTYELLDSDGKVTDDITKVKGYRLPTEAEWEFAAKGGNSSKGYKYSGSNDLDKVAWFSVNSEGKTHTVGTKEPNELGIYDMTGNVWEWIYDYYDKDFYKNSPVNNPINLKNITSERGKRGGAWADSDENSYMNTSYRLYSLAGLRHKGDLGFRIARSL